MNKIKLSGKLLDAPLDVHSYNKEVFYKFYIEVIRKSGIVDILPCVAPESIIDTIELGKNRTVYGEVRTRNTHIDGKSHLEVYVKVDRVGSYKGDELNEVTMPECYICKMEPLYKTRSGASVINVTLASNREGERWSDYIPTIFWNWQAMQISQCSVGTKLGVAGRLRSRVYQKRYENSLTEFKTAYEFSVERMTVLEEMNDE